MSAIDVLILAILALSVLAGFIQGFILEIATILGAVLGLTIAKLEYQVVENVLLLVFPRSRLLTEISYLLLFLVVWTAVVLMARKIRRLARLLLLGCADRAVGAILGLLQGALVVELLLYLAKRAPNGGLHRQIAHSKLAPAFLDIVPLINRLFPHIHA